MSIHYNKMLFCKYCQVNRTNYLVHEKSKKHIKLVELCDELETIKDKHNKTNVLNLIDMVRKNECSDWKRDYNRLYYNNNKEKKPKAKLLPTIVLKSRKEIKRDDNTIEVHEVWYDKECRFNNKKSK